MSETRKCATCGHEKSHHTGIGCTVGVGTGLAHCCICLEFVPAERRSGERDRRRVGGTSPRVRPGQADLEPPGRCGPRDRRSPAESSPEVAEGSTAAVVGGARVESGPVRIGDDWAGVFIRGDEAFSRALQIDGVAELREAAGDHWMAINLRGFADLLRSCVEPCEAVALRRADTPTPDGPNTAEPGEQP